MSSWYSRPKNRKCPVGTTIPLIEPAINVQIYSSQPELFKSGKSTLNEVNSSVIIGLVCLASLTLVVYLAVDESKRDKIFKKLDVFKKAHNHFVDEVMYIRTRAIGGLFSLFFVYIALLFIIASLVTYSINNIEETKALVPLVTLEDKFRDFTGDFNLTASFRNYIGQCNDDNGGCSSYITTTTLNVDGFQKVSCFEVDKDCSVQLICLDCDIQTGARVDFALSEPTSFTSLISANLTSTSSIPDEYSSIQQSIESSPNFLFSGSKASQIFFEVTPSVRPTLTFTSDSDLWESDLIGYHISASKAPVLGSQVTISE
jgi:hypothetical protein